MEVRTTINGKTYTTAMEYSEIEFAMNSVPRPMMPRKPRPHNVMTADDARALVAELEAYEEQYRAYIAEKDLYYTNIAALEALWVMKLREEYAGLNDATFKIVCQHAKENSNNREEWRDDMDTLAELAVAILAVNRGA